MAVRVAINGFGRIGRLTFRNMVARPQDFEIVGINDLTSNKTLATLLKYDSTHRRFDGTVSYDDQNLFVNGKAIRVFEERNPASLPWGDLGVDVVIDRKHGRFHRSQDRNQARLRFAPRRWCSPRGAECSGERRTRPDRRVGRQ